MKEKLAPAIIMGVLTCLFGILACTSDPADSSTDGDLSEIDKTDTDGDEDIADGDPDIPTSDEDGDGGESSETDNEETPPVYNWSSCERIDAGKSLAQKAAYFDQMARERHIAEDKLFRNLYLTEDLASIDYWYHTPNVILWSGIYLASQALRYAATGEQEAQENARRIVDGLRDLTKVTGISGLYGRSLIKPGTPYPVVADDAVDWADSTAEGYDGWRFNFDVSQDGYAGLMFGYGVALKHFDDEQLLADIGARSGEVAMHLYQNGLQIIDITGEVTEHGRLFHSALDNYPGFNAMLASSFIKVGQVALNDQMLDDFYYGCLMQMREGIDCPEIEDETGVDIFNLSSYIASMEDQLRLFIPNCQHNIDNFDMCYQAIYPLMTHETDGQLIERLKGVLRNNMFHNPDPDYPDVPVMGNSFFTFAYAALTGDNPDEDPILAEAVDLAICTLKQFPEEKFERYIPLGQQEAACANRFGEPNASQPIPLSEYFFDNYLWRLDFYEIMEKEYQEDRRLVYSPEDFLMAYWMARYHGLIGPEL